MKTLEDERYIVRKAVILRDFLYYTTDGNAYLYIDMHSVEAVTLAWRRGKSTILYNKLIHCRWETLGTAEELLKMCTIWGSDHPKHSSHLYHRYLHAHSLLIDISVIDESTRRILEL